MPRPAPPDRLALVSDPVSAALTWCEVDPSPLRRRCRVLFEVHSSILNGGFGGLLDNPTGELVPDAIVAADALGAVRAAELLADVVERLGTPYPIELEAREAAIEALSDEAWDGIDALTELWPQQEVDDVV